jgi:hypothetical protein
MDIADTLLEYFIVDFYETYKKKVIEMRNLILTLVISFFSQVSLGAARPSLSEDPSLGSILVGFDISKYSGVQKAREALFVKFVEFICTNWQYGSSDIDPGKVDLLALKGLVATDCGPIACCFIALLDKAKLLPPPQIHSSFLHCINAAEFGSSESRIYCSKQLFDTRYANNRLLGSPDEFGNIYRLHYLVVVDGVYYDPIFKLISSSLDVLDAVLIHPHREDPSLLIGTREGTEQKIVIKRLGPGKFQWQEPMSE